MFQSIKFQWFLNDAEVYRYVPEAKRELQRMVFHEENVKIDLESSKMIGHQEHLLVLQSVTRRQSGEYKCQVRIEIKEDLHRKLDFSVILLIQTTSAGMK